MNFQRKRDYFRFHPNQGGTLVTSSDYVQAESYVRFNIAIVDGNHRVNTLGAGGECRGNMLSMTHQAIYRCAMMNAWMLYYEKIQTLSSVKPMYTKAHDQLGTDMGNVSHLMPVIHPWVGCISGVPHSAEYEISGYPDVVH